MEPMAEQTSKAKPEAVWALLSDPATYSEWWSEWHSASSDELPLRAGGSIILHNVDHEPDNGRANDVSRLRNHRMEITELEPNRRLAIRNRMISTEFG